MIDFEDIMTDPELSQTVTLIRAVTQIDAVGRAVVVPTSTQEIVAVVQPSPPEATALYLPEGERANTGIDVWTTFQLRTAEGPNVADVLVYRDAPYRVSRVDVWTAAGLFFHAFCVRVP